MDTNACPRNDASLATSESCFCEDDYECSLCRFDSGYRHSDD